MGCNIFKVIVGSCNILTVIVCIEIINHHYCQEAHLENCHTGKTININIRKSGPALLQLRYAEIQFTSICQFSFITFELRGREYCWLYWKISRPCLTTEEPTHNLEMLIGQHE